MATHIAEVKFTEKGAANVTRALKDIEKQSVKTAASTNTAFKKFSTSSKQATASVKGISAGFSAFTPSTLLATAGLATFATGLKSIVNAGRDQERATRLTAAVLKSTGGEAGVTATQVEALASKLSLMSGVQDEVIQHGENVLLTFRSVRNEAGKNNDIFTQGTTAALDLSAALGQDLQSSIIQLGKALNDPIAGMTALRRVGVSFTQAQKDQIKALTDSGHLLEAQKVILAEVKAEFGGAAAASADPFSKLNTSVRELEESLGTTLIPTLSGFVGILTKAVNLTNKLSSIDQNRSKETRPVFDFLKGGATVALLGPLGLIFGKTKKSADDATKSVKAHAASVDSAAAAYAGLGPNIKTAADALDALNKHAFTRIQVQIDVETAQQSFTDALSNLTNPDTGSSGGGSSGSTQTATAAALERKDKEATLRDAIQGVADADQDAISAQKALTTARHDYLTVINGVAAGSKEAAKAEQDLTQAQDAAKSSVLDLRDARRQLADAIEAQSIAQREANEGLGNAKRSAAGARLDVADARQALADARADEDPTEILRAQLALGDAIQRQRDADEALTKARKDQTDAGKKNSKASDDVKRAQIGVTEAQIHQQQSTRDLTEAQRILNGVLNGFPPTSQEAQTALHNYQDALRTAREATDTAHDSTRNLERAQADLAGKLDAVGGSAGSAGKKVETLTQRLNEAKTAGIKLAEAAGAANLAVTHNFGASILAEIDNLRLIASANPLLAHAFDGALRDLESQFLRSIGVSHISKNPIRDLQASSIGGGHGRASGGPVTKGRSYIVGEKGPELFVPKTSGEIVPQSSLQNSVPFGSAPVVVQELHFHNHGVLAGNQVEAWLEESMARARRNGRDLDKRR